MNRRQKNWARIPIKEFGVKVLAPSEIVNIDFDGNIILSDNEENVRMGIETGKWITFKP